MFVSHFFELLRYHARLVTILFVMIVGGVVAFSTFFLFVSPIYTGTAIVSLLPTQTELAYSQNTVRASSINPANLLTATHIEYLKSREVARMTVDRISAQAPSVQAREETAIGLVDRLSARFSEFRRHFRRLYNTLNSGQHVEIDPYTDAVIDLQDSIEVEMIEGTYILEISVSWPDPRVAAMTANLLAEVYVERARRDAAKASETIEAALREEMVQGQSTFATLERQINTLRLTRAGNHAFLRVIEAATVPVYPSFPKVVINTVFGIVGWMFVTAFVLIAIDTFQSTIKTPSDLKRVLSARYLGRLNLRRPGRWPFGEARRILCGQSNGQAGCGGVLAFGSGHASRGLFEFVDSLLPRTAPAVPLPTAGSCGAPNGSRLSAPDRGHGDRRGDGAPLLFGPDVSGATGTAEQARLMNFGSIDAGFSFARLKNREWLVIGLYPGKVEESELRNMLDEACRHGVRNVFGVLLKG